MSLRPIKILFALLSLSGSACGINVQEQEQPTPTPVRITTTLTQSPPPRPSETPLSSPLPSQPTIIPFDGITSTEVNVRSEPSTASNVLGIIPADMRVEIIGKDPGESWWRVLYPQGADPEGKGWVAAQYIRTVSKPEVPIIGGVERGPNNGTAAVVRQQLNIRSGPGMEFNSIGALNPQDVVSLTGKDRNGTWLQIEFGAGPQGKGWVNAAFVQAPGVDALPIVTETGLIVGTGTPTRIPLTPTPTRVPAWEDHDSPTNPIISVRFEPAGTYRAIYTGDVSAPQGDAQDWIQFTPYSQTVLLEVSCKGNDLEIQVLQDGLIPPGIEAIRCGSKLVLPTKPDLLMTIRFSARSNSSLSYTSYTLYLDTIPQKYEKPAI